MVTRPPSCITCAELKRAYRWGSSWGGTKKTGAEAPVGESPSLFYALEVVQDAEREDPRVRAVRRSRIALRRGKSHRAYVAALVVDKLIALVLDRVVGEIHPRALREEIPSTDQPPLGLGVVAPAWGGDVVATLQLIELAVLGQDLNIAEGMLPVHHPGYLVDAV